ncbi:hypothetical protein PR048_011749 [Dryococelus australis]|uniref:Reverse transcriptase RNase H-like domain-containing protein n=1 Tax=Dryococelus australis TaxID=614101 RepID=A0ABQ9HMH8_9NEOP|nr:hypothetical protein PR048_011749 [Dryococelus australis]
MLVLDKNGLHTAPTKVQAILEAPIPTNLSELRPNLSSYQTSPALQIHYINCYEKEHHEKCQKTVWRLLRALKKLWYLPNFWHIMILLPVMPHPMALARFCNKFTQTKQSDRLHLHHILWLTKAEVNYSQIEKESLALVFCVKHFYQYLHCKKFVLVTDHKPLLSLFGPKKGIPVIAAARLQRFAVFLSNFNFDIVFVKSEWHGNVDSLSWLPLLQVVSEPLLGAIDDGDVTYLEYIGESTPPVTNRTICHKSKIDPLLTKVIRYILYGWPKEVPDHIKLNWRLQDQLKLKSGILMWGYRVFIPDFDRA